MSLFSDIFSTNEGGQLPEWLRSGAQLAEEGLDLYDRIAGGGAEPDQGPIRTQAPITVPTFGLTPMVTLVVIAVGLYLFLGISRRR